MLKKVISGGQTGVDRAALDWALDAGIEHGGWCPAGRKAEDGSIAERYLLIEMAGGYAQRTRQNVIHSDGTLILNRGDLNGGTLRTVNYAIHAGKQHLMLDLDTHGPEVLAAMLLRWLDREAISVLNVAGPRESKRPGVYAAALSVLRLYSVNLNSQNLG